MLTIVDFLTACILRSSYSNFRNQIQESSPRPIPPSLLFHPPSVNYHFQTVWRFVGEDSEIFITREHLRGSTLPANTPPRAPCAYVPAGAVPQIDSLLDLWEGQS